jgi:subtilase family serine protease
MAGIQALINQTAGGSQGNPNYVYYQLAGTSGVFNSVTTGDNAVNCSGVECFGASAAVSTGRGHHETATYNGVLSTSATSLGAAYAAGAGWNFANGFGSVNAANLVSAWMAALMK